MTMVFCRGCGKEIHETAPTCPHCGAPQGNLSLQFVDDSTTPTAMWDCYLAALKKYATFKGRAKRKEYWYFVLLTVIISMVLSLIDGAMGTFNEDTNTGLLSGIYSIGTFIPAISVAVRRLHDTNRSGWWLWLPIIPIIFLVSDTKPETNEYGVSAK